MGTVVIIGTLFLALWIVVYVDHLEQNRVQMEEEVLMYMHATFFKTLTSYHHVRFGKVKRISKSGYRCSITAYSVNGGRGENLTQDGWILIIRDKSKLEVVHGFNEIMI
ncbi:hypothetical protein N781_05560 [Pontibacillus halophilus JSM 076056 = DSM 19796]|uniref:Uncharacterized protein n=1 Tax=Pontibacillus halophilus JSM 076056 = DSM 19796 TaxID=1385510 RepID=A0A0A5GD89_9BACI|nr:hypothetical protein [Pontibacillus halophilus]KGX91186.1 hypothetical protein N781_05560 [Pontibacillus halophilus JSM 076056 = DSM 19796]